MEAHIKRVTWGLRFRCIWRGSGQAEPPLWGSRTALTAIFVGQTPCDKALRVVSGSRFKRLWGRLVRGF